MLTRSTALKQARLAADISTLGASAVLELGTAGMEDVICRFTLSNPVGTISGSTLTFSGFPALGSAIISGTIAAARVKTSASGLDVYTDLTVGMDGPSATEDIRLDAVSVVAGQNVRITSLTVND